MTLYTCAHVSTRSGAWRLKGPNKIQIYYWYRCRVNIVGTGVDLLLLVQV